MHDDPYGEGWLFVVKHSNLKRNLENLVSGEDAVIWIEEETHRLLNLLDSRLGVALPDGGTIVDDVYGNYQELGWRPLVHEFFLKNLTSKGFIPASEMEERMMKTRRKAITYLTFTLRWRAEIMHRENQKIVR